MTLERDDIKEIVAAVAAAGIEEFSLEVGDVKVRLKKSRTPTAGSPTSTAVPVERLPAPQPTTAAPPAVTEAAVLDHDGRREEPRHASAVPVRAPLIGTFYRAPAPDAPPFVEAGQVVEPDDTVCIVEVMKLMNGVRAGVRGRVVEICAENATLVEYGQTLMLIEPIS